MNLNNILNKVQKNKKKVSLSTTISSELKVKLEDLAKDNKVSISKLVEAILEESINNC